MRCNIHSKKVPLRGLIAGAALAVCAVSLPGYAAVSIAGESSQATFKSAEEASQALLLVVQNHDERELTHILGAGRELVSSDDEAQDSLDRGQFVKKYQEMHRLVRETHGDTLLYIGAENWPFPIPLVSHNGTWRFDSDAGVQEVRFRRIGENEATAIALCHTLVAAQGHSGTADSLTAAVLAAAKSDGKPVAFHGYYFRILPGSGDGFVAVARPVTYRSSGVMTFIINQDDVAHEKDLGPNTSKLAGAMAKYDADSTWKPAETP
jgi:hypothetical protein